MRRSTPVKKIDEQTFAVRVRIAIPETGLRRINDVHDWLRKTTDRIYAIHPASNRLGQLDIQQCAYIYVNDTAVALECVKTFDLSVYGLPKDTP